MDTALPRPLPATAWANSCDWPRYWPCAEGYLDVDCPIEEELGLVLTEEGDD